MNVIFLTNDRVNRPGTTEHTILQYLRKRDNVVAVPGQVTAEIMRQYDIGVSWFYRHILLPEQFNAPKYGVVNMHIACLPFGRGAMPNVWAIVRREPAGVTLHWIDEGIDTGPIIAQMKVPVLDIDTGETLYNRLCRAAVNLFFAWWPAVGGDPDGARMLAIPQRSGHRAYRTADVKTIDNLSLIPGAEYIIDVLRARTFPPHASAWIWGDNGKKIYVRVTLQPEQPG